MDSRLILLKLFLDELGVPDDIATVDDRKRVQKAVYLGQRSGLNLGYRFGWYLMGPYSPGLTKDYFALSEAISSGDREYESHALGPTSKAQLHRIASLCLVPANVAASQEDWLELLASLHYLRTVSGYSHAKSQDVLRVQKPHLAHLVNEASS